MILDTDETKVVVEALWNYIYALDDLMHRFPQFSDNNQKEIKKAKEIVLELEKELL